MRLIDFNRSTSIFILLTYLIGCAATGFAILEPGWSWLAYISLSMFPFVFFSNDRVIAYGAGSLGLVILNFVALSWIGTVMDGGLSFIWFSISIILALPVFAVLPLARRIRQRVAIPMTVLFPVFWVTFEVLRYCLFIPFDNNGMSALWLGLAGVDNSLLLQTADIFGVEGVTFCIALVNGFFADLIGYYLGWYGEPAKSVADSKQFNNFVIYPLILMVAVSLGVVAYGSMQVRRFTDEKSDVSILVMPGVLDSLGIKRFEQFVRGNPNETPRLALWGEVSLQGHVVESQWRETQDLKRLCAISDEFEISQIVGARTKCDDETHNSMIFIDNNQLTQSYDKQKQVAFAEFHPPMTKFLLANELISQQFESVRFDPPRPARRWEIRDNSGDKVCVKPLICYDVFFGSSMRHEPESRLMLCSLNESQDFGNYADINLPHCKLRCVETRMAMVRSSVGGWSGLISPSGETTILVNDLKTNSKPFVVRPTLCSVRTIYETVGFSFPWTCAFGFVTFSALVKAKKE